MEQKKDQEKGPLLKSFDEGDKKPFLTIKLIVTLIVVAVLGIGTGYFLSQRSPTISGLKVPGKNILSSAPKGTIVGSDDTKTFKDIVEGKLEEGGIEGEGQFHLVRPGGESQNVYLTSSIVDLSEYLGKEVKVWGQTQKAEYAGWLMDVGRLEVLK